MRLPSQFACGSGSVAHLHVKRFAVDSIPTGHEDITKWVYQRWEKKDELMKFFDQHGEFPDLQNEPVQLSDWVRNAYHGYVDTRPFENKSKQL